MSTPFRLQVPRRLVEEMIAQAKAELPNECCGLLAGIAAQHSDIARAAKRYPLTNAAASPKEYLSEPRSLLAAHNDMRRLGLDILAIYHSHPSSDPVPSRADCDRLQYPEAAHLIISLKTSHPLIRAWWLTTKDYHPADWEIMEES